MFFFINSFSSSGLGGKGYDGTGPDIDPDIGPDIDPGIGPDIGPGIGPGLGPDIGPGIGPGICGYLLRFISLFFQLGKNKFVTIGLFSNKLNKAAF